MAVAHEEEERRFNIRGKEYVEREGVGIDILNFQKFH